MQTLFIPIVMFIAYGAFLINVMVFRNVPTIYIGHMMFNFGGADANGQANFVPFRTILPYLLGYKGWVIAGINLAGNVGLPAPFGVLAALAFRKLSWQRALALSLATGLLIEGMQVVFHTGIFDIDDVILNGLGVMIGYWAFAVLLCVWRRVRPH